MTARMIRPFAITGSVGGSVILSSTATDPTAAWASGTTYARDAIVHKSDRVYISRISSNTGNDPVLDDGTKWIDNGPINPLAMFDGLTNTQTSATSPLTFVLQLPGWLDSLAVFDVVGTALEIKIQDGATTVYDVVHSLIDDEPVVDFYSYLFEELTYVRDYSLMNLPLTPNAKVTGTLTGGGTVKIGAFVPGTSLTIGEALQGSTAGVDDFSVVERNDYGTLFVTERNTAKEGSFEVVVPAGRGPSINNALRDLGRKVAAFVMAEGDSRAVILGYVQSYKFTWGQMNDERLSLDISGVT